MTVDEHHLHQVAAARAETLPGAELSYPFGPEWDVWKVGGKVFLLQTALRGEPLSTVKVAPADGQMLCEALPEVSPGYHMNKKHWITVRSGPSIDPELVEDLVTDSYLLVVERLPKAQRPVDPTTFGTHDR